MSLETEIKTALDALLGAGAAAGLPARVILDLQLPRYDGFEVLERLRADPRTRDLTVLVFTSSQHSDDRARCDEDPGLRGELGLEPLEAGIGIADVHQIGRASCRERV